MNARSEGGEPDERTAAPPCEGRAWPTKLLSGVIPYEQPAPLDTYVNDRRCQAGTQPRATPLVAAMRDRDERRAHETPTTNSTRPALCMSWPVARTRIQHSCARSRRESTEAAPRTPPEDELAITDRAVKSLGSAARTAVRRAVNAPASRTRTLRWASSTIERPTRFGSDADARGTSETRRQTRRRREIARCPFAGASWQR